jgi:hypothetical protein
MQNMWSFAIGYVQRHKECFELSLLSEQFTCTAHWKVKFSMPMITVIWLDNWCNVFFHSYVILVNTQEIVIHFIFLTRDQLTDTQTDVTLSISLSCYKQDNPPLHPPHNARSNTRHFPKHHNLNLCRLSSSNQGRPSVSLQVSQRPDS